MRAIIIDDKDARALIDSLRLESMTSEPFSANTRSVLERHKITPDEYRLLAMDFHSRFHYRVTTWLQEQGCNTVR